MALTADVASHSLLRRVLDRQYSSSSQHILPSRTRLRLAVASSFMALWLHYLQPASTLFQHFASDEASKALISCQEAPAYHRQNANLQRKYIVGRTRLLSSQRCLVPSFPLDGHQQHIPNTPNNNVPTSSLLNTGSRPTSTRRSFGKRLLSSRQSSSSISPSSHSSPTPSTPSTSPSPPPSSYSSSPSASSPYSSQESASSTKSETSSDQGATLPPSSEIPDINTLMWHPALLQSIKAPRNPIVLCHGLYGFDVRGPFLGLEIHYWASVLDILRKKVGAEVIVRGVPGTGAIADRALALHKFLCSPEAGIRGRSLNFIGHSMGGLDARHLISVIRPSTDEYKPVSLTTVSTPHRGSPFMDWCNANVGTGNERVEAEIQAVRKLQESGTLRKLDSNTGPKREEGVKLPFSLKSPLFVRPNKEEKVDGQKKSAIVDEAEDENCNKRGKDASESTTTVKAAQDVAATVMASATSPEPTTPYLHNRQSELKGQKEAKAIDKPDGKSSSSSSSFLTNFSAFSKALSSFGGSFSTYMLSMLDQPAYAMLSTRYMSQAFNPSVLDSQEVSYYSVATRTRRLSIWHPLWLPKLVLDSAAESRSAGGERDGSGDALGGKTQGNDGLVSVESAKWGTFLGVVDGCDHWDLRGGGAPRWRGRINPATGKPWPEKEEEKEKAAAKEKTNENSWTDINNILGKLVGASLSTKEQQHQVNRKDGEEEKKQSQTVSPQKQQHSLNEVAGWISDRLPRGDAERRAEAERAADEQDRKTKDDRRSIAQEDFVPQGEASLEEHTGNAEKDTRNDGSPSQSSRIQTKLRREAAWQEELGHDATARELRRELAWHRAEWDRATGANRGSANFLNGRLTEDGHSTSTSMRSALSSYPGSRELNWDAHAKERQRLPLKKPQDEADLLKKKREEANELERFWIAICTHLYRQGF